MSNVQGAVALSGVVPDLNVVVDCAGELDTSLPALAVKRLGLHPRPERLDHRIIERGADGPTEGAKPAPVTFWLNTQDTNCLRSGVHFVPQAPRTKAAASGNQGIWRLAHRPQISA